MIHLYTGDGKGKTTAAMGLALRMAGYGKQVLIAQFLKGSHSGERYALAALPTVTLLEVPEKVKFSFRMNEQERQEAAVRFERMLAHCAAAAQQGKADLIVLDEVCAAVNTGLLSQAAVVSLLEGYGDALEIVLTGRRPPESFRQMAHYVTSMEPLRHPYEQGIAARKGVEY